MNKKFNVLLLTLLSCVCLFATIFISAPVYAHYPWINIIDYTPMPGETIEITIGWGHRYPLDSFLGKNDLENISIFAPGGNKIDVNTSSALEFQSAEAITEQGIYVVAVKRKTGFYTKTTEGGKGCSKKGLKNVIKCFHSEMFAKAVINAGDGKGKADICIGHSFEIIPLANPADLMKGDSLPVQILLKGKPFKGEIHATYVGFSTEKNTFAYITKTNAKGKGEIKILHSGVWMIKVVHEEPYPDQTECDVNSYTATLTFEVK